MLSIVDFIKQNKFISSPITYSNKVIDPVQKWHTKTYDQSQKLYKEKFGGYLLDTLGEKKYIILDTDNEKANNFVLDLIEGNDYNIVSTPSYKNITQDKKSNNHYWFQLPDDFAFENKLQFKSHPIYGDLDILVRVAESKDTQINTNISVIHKDILTGFYNDECNKLNALLNILNKDTGNDFKEWGQIGMAMKAIDENNIKLFDEFSQLRKNYKGLKDIETHWNGFSSCENGWGVLYNLAKVDNNENLKIWMKKYNKKEKISSVYNDDFWDKLTTMNHSDFAKMYKEKIPSKYIVSKNKEWFEFNSNNILINQNGIPSSLTNNITDTLQKYIIEKRNELIPNEKDYDEKMKLIKKAYQKLGDANYTKGIIQYLEHLYLDIDLDDKIDNNNNLLAFNDKVYDITLKGFRNIEPSDYISKTTKMNAPLVRNDNKIEYIKKTLLDIFGSDELVNYWLKITALSLFTNKFESLYILTGTGGNGKGLLSTILTKILGDYMYTASNTFLTEKIKGGQANSTLAKCKGIRYLLVSEPDDGSNEAEFNVEFIKMITGGDTITTRDLYKSNFSFKPQFTPFIQCNKKPKLGKMDNGIKRRVKIQNFPFEFVETPTKEKPNQKQANTNFKSSMDKEFYDNFMILLLENASNHINDNKIEQPNDIIKETNNYFDDNNPVKSYISSRLETSTSKILISDLYDDYIGNNYEKISKTRFRDDLLHNEILIEKHRGYQYIMNYKIKIKSDFE
jgi:P4 family phage/plasmid primase-like protien